MAITEPTEAALQNAVRALHDGDLIAFPTETVYGLGAAALQPKAVARIFEAKKRPLTDPLICHVATVEHVFALTRSFSDIARILADTFWPGPLTLVLNKHARVPDIVTAGFPTVAIRVPEHPVATALLTEWDGPLAAPSANPFGRTSPTTAAHVEEQLREQVELILDGGPCRIGVESTIVDVSSPAAPRLLRPGGVAVEAIEAILGYPLDIPQADTLHSASPGRMRHHYAPRTPLYITSSSQAQHSGRVGRLAFTKADCAEFAAVEILSPTGDLREAAHRLFGALRQLDSSHVDVIEAEAVPEHGLGRAIMDRLRRAATSSK
ncbi:MAG: threonylcarbamoyl-AMP synthase [Myxococcales bacterium]|nr:threonylcarbamoyl-AMP synthase [Myxococcales bacterium]